nr:COP9 signalosome complex subunit 9 [Pogona vitticeps]
MHPGSGPLSDQSSSAAIARAALRLAISEAEAELYHRDAAFFPVSRAAGSQFRLRADVGERPGSSSGMMKPAVDEMFPEGAGPYVDLDEAGGSTGLLMDLAANEKAVHADFFNNFEDMFDDDDIQ